MVIDWPLQLSWLPAPFSSRTVRPVQDPTPLPAATLASTVAEPPMAKSAWVQAGLVLSVCELKAWTAAVTLWMNTGPGLELSKVPLSVTAVAPGNRLVTDVDWLTVSAVGVVAEAEPLPLPLPVQYA